MILINLPITFAAFISLVILRYCRQHMVQVGEAEGEQEEQQAIVVAEAEGKQEQQHQQQQQALVVAEVASNH